MDTPHPQEPSDTRPFLLDSTVMIGGGVLLGILNYTFIVIMAHVFSISGFGEFQTYASIISFASVVGTAPAYYAMRLSAWSSRDTERRELSSLIRFYLRYRAYVIGFLISAVGIILLAVFSAMRIHGTVLFLLVLLSVVTAILELFFSGIVQGTKKFFRFTSINLVSAFLQIVCAGLVGYITRSPVLALSGFVVSQLYALFFFEQTAVRSFRPDDGLDKGTRGILTSSLVRQLPTTFLFSLGLVVLSNGDIMLSRLVLSPEALGFMSIFLVIGKMVLFSNLALMGVILSYTPEGASSGRSGRVVIPLAYAIMGAIGIAGIGIFLLIPRFVLHTLFHVPIGSFLEPILWQAGVIELFLSFLSLEATVLFARKIRGMPIVLCVIALVFCVAMCLGGHSVESLARILAGVYAGGWLVLLTYRIACPNRVVQLTKEPKRI